ncbi:MAG: TPM domain-containing protein [Crocinitomicaceae bacterium]|nr:TPM domain-containing protein [Crocinitomicaceae bacterium]
MTRFILLIALISSQFSWSQMSINDVPNPKTNGTGYISNPDRIMSQRDVQDANQLFSDLELKDSFQVAMVVLESIGSKVPKDFATDLFAHWGIGLRNKDNGLLILFVNDQRRIEFETGYGTESVLSDYQCAQIQQDYMVPYFKNGDYSKGLLNGAEAICRTLNGKSVVDTPIQETIRDSFQLNKEAEIRTKKKRWKLIMIISAWHSFGLIIFLIALLIARLRNDPYDKYNTIRYFHLWIWAVLFPITHIFIVLLAKRLKARYRDMIRFSGKTGEIMHKLSDTEEDDHLSKGQLSEELVKSVDYDVWVTEETKDILILAYKPLFSKYSKCPNCRYKTYYKVYDKQIIAPSYSSSGKGEKKYFCENCNHTKRKTYRIPRLQRSNRTRSSGGGWVEAALEVFQEVVLGAVDLPEAEELVQAGKKQVIMHSIVEDLNWRYATKKFDYTQKVSNKDLEVIKESLRLTATSFGLQPLKFIIIKGDDIREQLRAASYGQEQLSGASHIIVICTYKDVSENDVDAYMQSITKQRGTPAETLEQFSGYIKGWIKKLTPERRSEWTSRQAYIALGHLLQTCATLRIDSTPMEGFDPEAYDKLLDLSSKNLEATLVCPIGYRHSDDETQHRKKVRKGSDEMFITIP